MLESSETTKVVAAVDGAAAPQRKRKPHPVFGHTHRIKGFALSRQLTIMLDFWHNKACKLAAKAKRGSKERSQLLEVRGKIFRAAIHVKPRSGQEVASQLEIMAREFDANICGTSLVSVKEFRRLARGADLATRPEWPEKPAGALTRGTKLTRAGLLVRYQAYLVQELETVSWHLYGSRDFAKHYRMDDTEVNRRCRPRGRKWRDPFFQEATLPQRARAVLSSLRINTVDEDEHEARRRKAMRAAVARQRKAVG